MLTWAGVLGNVRVPAGQTSDPCGSLTTSWGIDSLPEAKSPVRHSPNAIVWEVPSVMSRTVIGAAGIAPGTLRIVLESTWNRPLAESAGLSQVANRSEAPTEAK